MKKLEDLTEFQYNKLKEIGMLWVIYSDAPSETIFGTISPETFSKVARDYGYVKEGQEMLNTNSLKTLDNITKELKEFTDKFCHGFDKESE